MHNATALTTQSRSDIAFPQLDTVPGNGLSVLPYPSQRTAMGLYSASWLAVYKPLVFTPLTGAPTVLMLTLGPTALRITSRVWGRKMESIRPGPVGFSSQAGAQPPCGRCPCLRLCHCTTCTSHFPPWASAALSIQKLKPSVCAHSEWPLSISALPLLHILLSEMSPAAVTWDTFPDCPCFSRSCPT